MKQSEKIKAAKQNRTSTMKNTQEKRDIYQDITDRTEIMNAFFIVTDESPNSRLPYVASRPGFYRRKDGKQIRDGSPLASGPEMTSDRNHALRFPSRIAAARVASHLSNPMIRAVAN